MGLAPWHCLLPSPIFNPPESPVLYGKVETTKKLRTLPFVEEFEKISFLTYLNLWALWKWVIKSIALDELFGFFSVIRSTDEENVNVSLPAILQFSTSFCPSDNLTNSWVYFGNVTNEPSVVQSSGGQFPHPVVTDQIRGLTLVESHWKYWIKHETKGG